MDTALLDQYNIDCGVSLCLSAQTGERKKKEESKANGINVLATWAYRQANHLAKAYHLFVNHTM